MGRKVVHSKKILFYINTICGGGAERVMVNLASAFSKREYEVVLVTSSRTENEYTLYDSVKRISLEERECRQGRIKKNVQRVWKLRSVCRKEKPDVLISFMGEPNCRALAAASGLPVKNIISVRSDPSREYQGKIRGFLAKYLLPLADGCVFQTEDAKKWFPEKLQKKSQIIFNMVREEFYKIKYVPVPGRFVSCGRLEKVKNYRLAVEAFKDIAEDYPQAELWIYGEGEQKENLEQQIAGYNLQDRIHLKGRVNDVPKVLSQAFAFILPSVMEGMPNALMEAMAAGVPCIAADCPCGGPRALIESGVNGLLVESNNIGKMALAMKSLLDNREQALALGKNAKERAQLFQEKQVFLEWEKYIDAVCK